jgi:hypothetical protein
VLHSMGYLWSVLSSLPKVHEAWKLWVVESDLIIDIDFKHFYEHWLVENAFMINIGFKYFYEYRFVDHENGLMIDIGFKRALIGWKCPWKSRDKLAVVETCLRLIY